MITWVEDKRNLEREVMQCIRKRPDMRAVDICNLLGVHDGAVSRVLCRLRDAGRVKRKHHRGWRYTAIHKGLENGG